MELWILILMYIAGVVLVGVEMFIPGMIVGLVGTGLTVTSIAMTGMNHSWFLAGGETALFLVVVPTLFWYGSKRMALKESLSAKDGVIGYAKDYEVWLDKVGYAETDLLPAGLVRIDGTKLDVVTLGEPISRGSPVRVTKVRGNVIVVRAV